MSAWARTETFGGTAHYAHRIRDNLSAFADLDIHRDAKEWGWHAMGGLRYTW